MGDAFPGHSLLNYAPIPGNNTMTAHQWEIYLRAVFPEHSWHFDGNLEIPASASPKIVPAPYSDPSAIDPEEAFVASLASCHML